MAAVAEHQENWLVPNANSENTVTYSNYIKNLPLTVLFHKTVTTAHCATSGLAWGALIGGLTGPAGTVPGLLIGGAVGSVMGLLATHRESHNGYLKYRGQLVAAARKELDEALCEKVHDDSKCGILLIVPNVPVRIKGRGQVYEMSAIKTYGEKNNWISPMRASFTENDLTIAEDVLVQTGKACDEFLNSPSESARFDRKVIEGFKILREEAIALALKVFSTQADILEMSRQQKESARNKKIEEAKIKRSPAAMRAAVSEWKVFQDQYVEDMESLTGFYSILDEGRVPPLQLEDGGKQGQAIEYCPEEKE